MLVAGRVAATWEVSGGAVHVALFAEVPPVDPDAARAGAAHLHPGLPVEVVRVPRARRGVTAG